MKLRYLLRSKALTVPSSEAERQTLPLGVNTTETMAAECSLDRECGKGKERQPARRRGWGGERREEERKEWGEEKRNERRREMRDEKKEEKKRVEDEKGTG